MKRRVKTDVLRYYEIGGGHVTSVTITSTGSTGRTTRLSMPAVLFSRFYSHPRVVEVRSLHGW